MYDTSLFTSRQEVYTIAGEGPAEGNQNFISKVKELNYRERSAAVDIPTLEEGGTRADGGKSFKFLNGFEDVDMGELFEIGRNQLTGAMDPNLVARKGRLVRTPCSS